MKNWLTLVGLVTISFLVNACCFGGCKNNGEGFAKVACESPQYIEKQVTEWVEETQEIVVSGKGGKGTITETITTRRPVVHTIKERIDCGPCGSKFCPKPECCGIVPRAVLKRATAQGGSGEPHLGTIPTMKVLVRGARTNSELMGGGAQ